MSISAKVPLVVVIFAFAFTVLGLVSSVLSKEIGWKNVCEIRPILF